MSHIRGKDTSIETLVRSFLFAKGLRFRKNDKRYPGHPDVVLPKYHTVVFVNGCFWHMHEDCTKHAMPKSNVEFWSAKLLRNRDRDAKQHAELERLYREIMADVGGVNDAVGDDTVGNGRPGSPDV